MDQRNASYDDLPILLHQNVIKKTVTTCFKKCVTWTHIVNLITATSLITLACTLAQKPLSHLLAFGTNKE